tara:strand:+ start:580 stop:819 length:240 start_codon:yes stop_codon:yes gene_type:complete
MQTEKINTHCIESFIKTVKAADFSRQKEIKIDIKTAKDISYTLQLILLRYTGNLEQFLENQNTSKEETIQVNLDGGQGW